MSKYNAEKYWSEWFTVFIDCKDGTYKPNELLAMTNVSTGFTTKGDMIVGRSLLLKAALKECKNKGFNCRLLNENTMVMNEKFSLEYLPKCSQPNFIDEINDKADFKESFHTSYYDILFSGLINESEVTK